ncbi:DUF1570 domain-containing protein [Stieleria sp. ICT_E10.1]|uniref:DUF1570 domain-containing protein n=1 Tax=Stieleria sedimenti TaxID=2976331 RepID=UPI00217F8D29|nr:DUF1570 domain-containing protein [Stieleria sedimenti]MCS7467511.1 DUF1570 domain-containing protein [Stieleria sedimenti]
MNQTITRREVSSLSFLSPPSAIHSRSSAIRSRSSVKRFVSLTLVQVLIAGGMLSAGRCGAAAPALIEFTMGSNSLLGIPIMDFPSELIVLARDGQLHTLTGKAKENIRTLEASYQPATTMEMKVDLQKEFGRDFEVISTQHFLVVQPRGRGERWPQLFERSHRAFVAYMSRRGVQIRRGRFPMVAVVMPDSAAMYAELQRMNVDVKRVAGIYARESNRVITHDGGHLRFIADTVRHEAAHQSAYNYNVHSRVVITPRWVTEGVGQMFEPEAMVRGQSGLHTRDRVNQSSLEQLRTRYDGGRSPEFADAVRDLVGANEMFNNPATTADAYAVAWAMMFYLAEREPERFTAVLSGTASRGTYQPYDRFARLNDFERWVGTDIDQFAKKVSWFLKSL